MEFPKRNYHVITKYGIAVVLIPRSHENKPKSWEVH